MRFLLPAGVISGILLLFFHPSVIGQWVFALSLAGTVGMFTNTIAIKMFFHPLYPTPLGRQGVIPRNKDRIAEALSAAIERNVLQPQQIIDYIERHQLIDQGIQWLDEYAINYLNDNSRREIAINKIIEQIQIRLPELTDKSLTWIIHRFRELWEQEKLGKQFHELIIQKIAEYLNIEKNREQIYELILTIIQRNIPTIARTLQQLVDNYEEELSGIRRFVFQVTTSAMDINAEKIREVMEKSLEDPATRAEIILFIDRSMEYFLEYLNSEEIQELIGQRVEKAKIWIENEGIARTSPLLLDFLQNYLQNPETWKKLNQQIDYFSEYIRKRARKYLEDPHQQENIKNFIKRLIVELNIRNIIEQNMKRLPMHRFEDVIMRTTGNQLAWLEILGGILGVIAGLSFIRWQYIFVLPILLGLIYLIEQVMEWVGINPYKNNAIMEWEERR